MKKLYTCGYGNHKIEEFIALLQKNKIDVLVDVRSRPYSKWQHNFNRESLKDTLIKNNIKYVYRGRNLGGLDQNTDWDKSIDELAEKCENRNIAVMCSENLPENCHRKSTIQPAIEKKGVEVIHLLWQDGKVAKKKEVPKLLSLF